MPPVPSANPTKTVANSKIADNQSLRLPGKPALARSGALGAVVDQFLTSGGNTDSQEDFRNIVGSGVDTARSQKPGESPRVSLPKQTNIAAAKKETALPKAPIL